MACTILVTTFHLARVVALLLFLTHPSGGMSFDFQENANRNVQPNLVRVSIITESRGAKGTFEINGKVLKDYDPVLIHVFSSTGIVLDHAGHVLTFPGYSWVDIQGRNSRIEITAPGGQKWKGRLVGIDQTNGAAVVQITGAKLRKTPICAGCEIKDGARVVTPVDEAAGMQEFEARIVSVGNNTIAEQSRWVMTLNRPFPEIGQPILTTDHRVLGFVASQDPLGARAIVYPISTLISSADRIIKKGGDIPAGWLGVFVTDSLPAANSGVVVQGVVPESPAQKAGIAPQDSLLKYNGQQIVDALQFIDLVQSTPIGTKATLEIIRQGNPMTLTALIGPLRVQRKSARPALNLSDVYRATFNPGSLPGSSLQPQYLIGIGATLITPDLSKALQLSSQTGLLVTDVEKDRPAGLAGIEVGDIVLSIDGQPIVDAPGFMSHFLTRDWRTPLLLEISHKGTVRTVSIQLPEQH
jgi:S1-C subfamily serine protease